MKQARRQSPSPCSFPDISKMKSWIPSDSQGSRIRVKRDKVKGDKRASTRRVRMAYKPEAGIEQSNTVDLM